jgi:hypothetical protein
MCSCNGNCQSKDEKPLAAMAEKKIYICSECNTFTATPSGRPAPECCGKKMQGLE